MGVRPLLLALLCCLCMASGESYPSTPQQKADEKVSLAMLSFLNINQLTSKLGKTNFKELFKAVKPKTIKSLFALAKSELTAQEVSKAVDRKASFIGTEAGKFMGKMRSIRELVANASMKEDRRVASSTLSSKDSAEACVQNPLGCIKLGIPGVLATAKAKVPRADPGVGERILAVGSTELRKEMNENRIVLQQVRKRWTRTAGIRRFYRKRAQRASAKLRSALDLAESHVAEQLVSNGVKDRVYDGKVAVTKEAVKTKMPAWKQEEKDAVVVKNANDWGEKKRRTAKADAKKAVGALAEVITKTAKKRLGVVEVPRVLENMANPGIWKNILAAETARSKAIQLKYAKNWQIVKSALKPSKKSSKAAPEVQSLDDDNSDTMDVALKKQSLKEEQIENENPVEKKLNLYTRPTTEELE